VVINYEKQFSDITLALYDGLKLYPPNFLWIITN